MTNKKSNKTVNMKFLFPALLIAVVVISGCSQPPQNPVDTLKSSQEKSEALVSYLIKYDGATTTKTGSETSTENFNIVLTKLGNNSKTQTFSENKLVQEFIKNEFGVFACDYSVFEGACFETKEIPSNYMQGIKDISDTGIMIFKNSGEKSIRVGDQARNCDYIEFELNLSKLQISPEDSALGKVLLEGRSGSSCLDKETGVLLESQYLARYKIVESSANFQIETTQKATEFQTNPSLTEETFSLPADANIIPLEEE